MTQNSRCLFLTEPTLLPRSLPCSRIGGGFGHLSHDLTSKSWPWMSFILPSPFVIVDRWFDRYVSNFLISLSMSAQEAGKKLRVCLGIRAQAQEGGWSVDVGSPDVQARIGTVWVLLCVVVKSRSRAGYEECCLTSSP